MYFYACFYAYENKAFVLPDYCFKGELLNTFTNL
jgi:hypothetical protein